MKYYNNLPDTWQIKSLNDIGDVSMCKRIFKEQTNMKGDIPFYKIGTFGRKADSYISLTLFNEYKKKYPFPKEGDILISASGTIGRVVVYNGEKAYFQDSNIVWVNNDEKQVINKYLYYFYLTKPWQITNGNTISRLYNEDILTTKIPFPTLAEQKRIVKILETKMESVKSIRQAIQDQLKTANIMLDAYICTIYNSQKQMVKIGEIASINPSIREMKVKKNDIDVSFVPMSAVDADTGTINNAEKRKLHEVRKGYTYFEENDIIFAKITPCMQNGKHAIAKNLVNGIGFGSTEFHVIRPSTEVMPEWIHYFLRQKTFLDKAENYMQGAVGQQRLPDDYLYDTIIPLPPIDEQKKHISFLQRKQDKLGRTNKLLIEQAAYVDALPSSILRQAFNGEL